MNAAGRRRRRGSDLAPAEIERRPDMAVCCRSSMDCRSELAAILNDLDIAIV
jgi:hypothetical protein